jgi:APA family basic amino acid/polyamine antiporter
MSAIMRRKTIEASIKLEGSHRLKATLSWPHLVAMGVGAIVGTGIYTLTGIGAGLAGPAVVLSFLICGAICACAAFCYAEMATLIPVAGSAYTYSYSVLGEMIAWIVGWSLILEYTVAAAAVSIGWAGHAEALIVGAHWPVPSALMHGIGAGGLVNLPFVVLASQAFDAAHFTPFAPFGYGATPDASGKNYGVLAAAAIVFFAFYGFDAVSTAAEETKNPSRNLTIGIVGSMALCTAIYIVVATVAVGALSFREFSQPHDAAPLVFILHALNQGTAARIVAAAVVIAIPSVILVLMYGQSRIFFVMARDGLLPPSLAAVHKTRGTPVLMTAATGLVVALLAAVLKLDQIALLANAGTLCAFVAVAASMLVLRVRDPGRPRPFRTPLPWVVGPVCIAGCLYLFLNGLPTFTQWWFVIWNGIGLVLYLAYGAWRSRLARATN